MFTLVDIDTSDIALYVTIGILILFLIIFRKKITTKDECPYCHSTYRSRLRKKGAHKPTSETILKHYRCLNCHKTFYLYTDLQCHCVVTNHFNCRCFILNLFLPVFIKMRQLTFHYSLIIIIFKSLHSFVVIITFVASIQASYVLCIIFLHIDRLPMCIYFFYFMAYRLPMCYSFI